MSTRDGSDGVFDQLERGNAVAWSELGIENVGIVMDKEDVASVAGVRILREGRKYYMEPFADRERDRYNVPVVREDSPLLAFYDEMADRGMRICVLADRHAFGKFGRSDCSRYGMHVLEAPDGNKLVPKKQMDMIENCWYEEAA